MHSIYLNKVNCCALILHHYLPDFVENVMILAVESGGIKALQEKCKLG